MCLCLSIRIHGLNPLHMTMQGVFYIGYDFSPHTGISWATQSQSVLSLMPVRKELNILMYTNFPGQSGLLWSRAKRKPTLKNWNDQGVWLWWNSQIPLKMETALNCYSGSPFFIFRLYFYYQKPLVSLQDNTQKYTEFIFPWHFVLP